MIYGLRNAIEGALNVFRIGEANVAPDAIGAAGQAQGVAQAAARQGKRQAGLVGSSSTTRASATAASCGRCETTPTAQSCVSASIQTG